MKNSEDRSVLFIDDEPYVLEALKRCLMNQGFKVVTSTNVGEALRWLSTDRFQIVVADYDMPEMMGPEFLEKVRQLQPCAIRIVLTGTSDLRVIQQFIQEGKAMRYLLKPWDVDELREALRESFEFYSEAR